MLLLLLLFFALIIRGVALAGASRDEAWLGQVRFMAYTPSEFRVVHGEPIPASPASIAEDLRVLRPHVDGLITYSVANGLDEVVRLAQEAGFRAVILGIWSPGDRAEVATAIGLARQFPGLVRALVVGNEGLFWERYTWGEVNNAMARLRRAVPHVALTTSEPMGSYLGPSPRLGCEHQDFLLPNIHPIFEPWFRPGSLTQAVDFVLDIQSRLYRLCGKHVLIKETGVPSAPSNAGFTPARQRTFWRALIRRLRSEEHVSMALFEAFDAPWKIDEIARDSGRRDEREAAWGWFTTDRSAKSVVDVLRPLLPAKRPAGSDAQ
jgi:exo-beta-1,3-glucanase (GH17 family)